MIADRFWEEKPLAELSDAEWEALCDGCGRCCLYKLEDEESGEIAFTRVACGELDLGTCRCRSYERRLAVQPFCVVLKRDDVERFAWLPPTCAYRLLAAGEPLPPWHPLVSDAETVHASGASVRAWAIPEEQLGSLDDELEEHVIDLE